MIRSLLLRLSYLSGKIKCWGGRHEMSRWHSYRLCDNGRIGNPRVYRYCQRIGCAAFEDGPICMPAGSREGYERAAEDLENGLCPSAAWKDVYWQAWYFCNDRAPGSASARAVDLAAARLLRECIAKGKPLP